MKISYMNVPVVGFDEVELWSLCMCVNKDEILCGLWFYF